LIGFQGDFTFDERMVRFQDPPAQNAGLTAGNWNVSANVLPGPGPVAGPIKTLRISAFSLDMTLKTIRYTLDYDWEPPRGGTWRLVEGDVKDVQGSYRFEPAGPRTKATCSQSIDIGFWVPGPIRRPFEQKALRDSVEDFKKAVEARARRRAR